MSATTNSEVPTTKSARVQHAMLSAITWYQSLRPNQPSPCRFFPSCSEYGYEAISQFGARRGGVLTVRRLVRCRPFGPSGFDPVPVPYEDGVAMPTECCNHKMKDH